MALGTSVLIVAGVLVAVVAVVGVVYLATTLLSQGKSKERDDEEDGDTASDGDVAPSKSGTPSSGQDPNDKRNTELTKLAKAATQGAALGNAIGMANNAIRETADTVKDAVDTISSYVNRGPNNPLLGGEMEIGEVHIKTWC